MASSLIPPNPHRRRSPSYNLLVNFASLLEGYVRWDKKYPEWYPPFAAVSIPSLPLSRRSLRVITILRLCCAHQHQQHCRHQRQYQHQWQQQQQQKRRPTPSAIGLETRVASIVPLVCTTAFDALPTTTTTTSSSSSSQPLPRSPSPCTTLRHPFLSSSFASRLLLSFPLGQTPSRI